VSVFLTTENKKNGYDSEVRKQGSGVKGRERSGPRCGPGSIVFPATIVKAAKSESAAETGDGGGLGGKLEAASSTFSKKKERGLYSLPVLGRGEMSCTPQRRNHSLPYRWMKGRRYFKRSFYEAGGRVAGGGFSDTFIREGNIFFGNRS